MYERLANAHFDPNSTSRTHPQPNFMMTPGWERRQFVPCLTASSWCLFYTAAHCCSSWYHYTSFINRRHTLCRCKKRIKNWKQSLKAQFNERKDLTIQYLILTPLILQPFKIPSSRCLHWKALSVSFLALDVCLKGQAHGDIMVWQGFVLLFNIACLLSW